MRKLGGGLVALLVWLSLLALPVVAFPTDACAAEGPRAALVVDTGDSVHTYCVVLPDEQVSGLELIALAGEQHGLSYRFGYGGAAVCMLADVGTTGDDCFERYPDFWGYWRGSNGGWTWSSTGAGSTTVGDGDVEGWSWGSGSDGSSHPRPPATAFSSVCPVEAEPNEQAVPPKDRGKRPNSQPQQGSRPAARPDRPAAVAPDSAEGPREEKLRSAAESTKKKRRKKEGRRKAQARSDSVEATPTPSRDAVLASDDMTNKPEGSAPPATGLVAIGLAGALGAAGFVIARRRRGPA